MSEPRLSIIVTLFLCLGALQGVSQFKKLKTVELTGGVKSCAVDRPGELYITTADGQMMRYDVNGILKITMKNTPTPTLFDPHDGARLFAFYRDQRKYEFLNPSFEPTEAYRIDSAFVIDPWLACLSGDKNLWVIDAADKTLKKINTTRGDIDVDVAIAMSLPVENIVFLREYQGFVFVLVRDWGVLIFNGLGKQIKAIENKSIVSFNFLGEELYYPQGNKLVFFDLFSTDTREVALGEKGDFAILTDERLFVLKGNTVDFFKASF